MHARQRLYQPFGYEGVGVGSTIAKGHTTIYSNAKVQYIGVFVGRGAMENVAQDEGDEVAARREGPSGANADVAQIPERNNSRRLRRPRMAQLEATTRGRARLVGGTAVRSIRAVWEGPIPFRSTGI